jgi:hypothetical protein
LFVIVSFILINSAAFFALNSPIIQNAIVSFVNTNYLAPKKLKLSVNSFSLNPFTGALNLNEIEIFETGEKKTFEFKLSQVAMIFNLTSSYFTRKPVLTKVLLRGTKFALSYKPDGHFLLPDFLDKQEKSESQKDPIDIPALLTKIMPLLPREVVVLNANAVLGQSGTKNYQNINLSYLELKKSFWRIQNQKVDVKILLNNTFLQFPFLDSNLDFKNIQVIGSLFKDGRFDFETVTVDSNVLKLRSKANIKFDSEIRKSTYQAAIKLLEIEGDPFFKLIDFKSSGIISANGKLSSEKDFFDIPVFSGKANWKKLTLEGFDIYSGSADVYLKNKTIFYKDAKILTKRKGIVFASGEFRLFDSFHFENKAVIENFSFEELLAGLKAPDSPVDFRISSKNISVSGNIKSKNRKDIFDLSATGKGFLSEFLVTSFDQKGRNKIPQMNFNLNLNASSQGISIDKSSATLGAKSDLGSASVKKGYIDLTPKKGVGVFVGIIGKDIDVGISQYFLKYPASGKADIDAEVTVNPKIGGVFFKSKSSVQNGELFGVRFNHLEGEWGLDPYGVWVKKTRVELGSKTDSTKSAVLNMTNLRIEYKNLNSDINAYATGDIAGLASSLSKWIPQQFASSSGEIDTLDVHLKGLLLQPSMWDISTNTRVTNLKILNGEIGKSQILLQCIHGACLNSYAYFDQISENLLVGKKANKKNGFVFAELKHVSFVDSQFKIKLYQVPLGLFQPLFDEKVIGSLSADVQMTGKWEQIGGFANIDVTQAKIQNFDAGNVKVTIRPENDILQFKMSAFQNQMNVNFNLPQRNQKDADVGIHFINFDPTLLMDGKTRSSSNLFSQLTGDILFHGPSPFSKEINGKEDFLEKWSGTGRFQKGTVQVGNLFFNLIEIGDLTLSHKKFVVKEMNLVGDLGKIQVKGEFDFAKNDISMMTSLDLDLSNLYRGFSAFDPSEGAAVGVIYAKGTLSEPKFSGNIRVNAKSLQIKKIPPAFTDVKGNIVFHDSRAEIEKLTAKKGQGSVTLAGWVDFSNLIKGKSSHLSVNLNSASRNAEFRIQVPAIQFVDLELSSDIALSGDQRPYEITGQVNLNKLHVFRDATCSQLSAEILSRPKIYQSLIEKPFADLDVSIRAVSSIDIQTKCVAGKFSTSPTLDVVGDTTTPLLNGGVFADNAKLYVLKSRFNVKKADIQFVEFQKYDPNVDIQMEARYSPSYTVYWNIYGRLSEARLDLSVDPPTLPNGDRILQADLISAISTGQMPLESSSGNLLTASTGVASFLGINNVFENTLNDAVTNVTGGFVDSVSVVPTTQSGQLSWRATARKSISSRFDLGVSYESGTLSTIQSTYANYMFNDTVSAVGSYNYTSYFQQQSTSELFSGLRFYFGTQ